MPPNFRRRKIKSDAAGRSLLKEKGGPHQGGSAKRQARKAASEFHDMPHLHQAAPDISDFIEGGDAIKSITERNALDEFLESSLASQAFYDKQNAVRILVQQTAQQSKSENYQTPVQAGAYARVVPIPRRPVNYVSGKPQTIHSAAELEQLETEAFLTWRLSLAEIEEREGRAMTPFERNLEFWRQLWRVLEKSDVVVQIIDARNPLFFRSIDLENYVKEIHSDKEILILLNKSDLVPQAVRQDWARWFRNCGVGCLFFSALEELKSQGVEAAIPNDGTSDGAASGVSDEETTYYGEDQSELDTEGSSEFGTDGEHNGTGNASVIGSSSGMKSARRLSGHSKPTSPPLSSIGGNTEKSRTTPSVTAPSVTAKTELSGKSRMGVSLESSSPPMMMDGEGISSYVARVCSSAPILDAHALLGVLQEIRKAVLKKRESQKTAEVSERKRIDGSLDNDQLDNMILAGAVLGDPAIGDASFEDAALTNATFRVTAPNTSSRLNPQLECPSLPAGRSDAEPAETAMDGNSDGDSLEEQLTDGFKQSVKRKKEGEIFQMDRYRDPSLFVVGLVGYPNVGKSSVINSILGHKAVSVSRQPGKTKHFQTLSLKNVGLTLCDCPGLVFPQIVSTRAELVTNGVSPIDHLRGDFIAAIQILCDSISSALVVQYNLDASVLAKSQDYMANKAVRGAFSIGASSIGIAAAQNLRLDATQFLTAVALSRGHISGGKGGLPDLFQVAKFILRDFTTGRLRHWQLPPDHSLGPGVAVPACMGPSKQGASEQRAGAASLPQERTDGAGAESLAHSAFDDDDDDDQFLLDVAGAKSSQTSPVPATKKQQRRAQKAMLKGKGISRLSAESGDLRSLRGFSDSKAIGGKLRE